MKKFSIRDMERFSGLRAHTLRTWEYRHGVPSPQRNPGNSRYYSLYDVQRVLNMALLNANGFRISCLSTLSVEEITERIQSLKGDQNFYRHAVHELLVQMYAMNVEAIEAIFDRCFLCRPMHTVLSEVIRPFLEKVELFWQGRRLSEEHFVVTIIRKKILWAIERTENNKQHGLALLFLPPTRQLDLALLYVHYFLKHNGLRVLYMGNDVSLSNLESVFDNVKPHFVYTYVSQKDNFEVEHLADLLRTKAPETRLLVSHPQQSSFLSPAHPNVLSVNCDEAIRYMTEGIVAVE